jgi:hypothetical protein
MKYYFSFSVIALFLISTVIFQNNRSTNSDLEGAWTADMTDQDGNEMTSMVMIKDNFLVETIYNLEERKFYYTFGGSYELMDKKLAIDVDFSTMDVYKVGDTVSFLIEIKDDKMYFDGVDTPWKRIDNGTESEMSRTWFFAGRYRDGELSRRALSARKTMKMLTGTRFQWIAYNDETGQFSGTGGGNFTTVDGKYTENIEFFSRDSSRVGASLSFDYELIDGEWHHSGFSSKGDPMHEIWAPYEKLKAMSESKE